MEKRFRARDGYVGKRVIDADGMIIGSLKDIAFDLGSKEIVFSVSTPAGTEVALSQSDVSAVGDVILVKSPTETSKPPAPVTPTAPTPSAPTPTAAVTYPKAPPPVEEAKPSEPLICPKCGYRNEPTTKFCIKCGTRLR